MIKVILTEAVPGQGNRGDVLNVSDGFARNYLIPQGKAIVATEDALNKIAQEQKSKSEQTKKLSEEHEVQKIELEKLNLEIKKKTKNGKLFGSVSPKDIAQSLEEKGYKILANNITINNPIKAVGEHKVGIVLDNKTRAEIKINVAEE